MTLPLPYGTILYKISGLSSSTGRGNGVAVGSKPLQSVRNRRRVVSCVLAAQQRPVLSRRSNDVHDPMPEVALQNSEVKASFVRETTPGTAVYPIV
jgi:hypothetical protein